MNRGEQDEHRWGSLGLALAMALAAVGATACSSDTALGEAAGAMASPLAGSLAWGSREAIIASVQGKADESYDFAALPGDRYEARLASQHLYAVVGGNALAIAPTADPMPWFAELRWTATSRPGSHEPVSAPTRVHRDHRNRVHIHRDDGSIEWFVAGPLGVEQGFVLPRPPRGPVGPLELEISVRGSLTPTLAADGMSVSLRNAMGTPVLRYSDLFARDATGRLLEATMEVGLDTIELRVDDAEAAYPLQVDPLIWTEMKKLVAPEPDGDDSFGKAVAIDGEMAIVGAYLETANDGDNILEGAAHIHYRDEGGPDEWGHVAVVRGDLDIPATRFGGSVAIASDVAIVGASHWNDEIGKAVVFYRDEGGPDHWGEIKYLASDTPEQGARFGGSVAMSSDLAVVGATRADGSATDVGAAYVFARDEGGPDDWGLVTTLTSVDGEAFDRFGNAVAVSGDVIVVGASAAVQLAGAAYVFARDQGGPDSWGQVAKLVASDGAGGDHFGTDVAVSGDVALVGAPDADGAAELAGVVYVFARNEGGPDQWGEVAKLTVSDGEWVDSFGSQVALSGDTAVVTAPNRDVTYPNAGIAYVFTRNGADQWEQTGLLTAADGKSEDRFGQTVALFGAAMIVGVPRHDVDDKPGAGAAYVFALRFQNGDPCISEGECASSRCVDGVCCDTTCGDGEPDDCQACSVATGAAEDGTCTTLEDGTPCADGACVEGSCEPKPHGAPCTEASECNSQLCIDDVCCLVAECTPYRCGVGGLCGVGCNNASDCAAGYSCSSDGKCVAAVPEETEEGCGCRVPSRRTSTSGWLAAGALVVVLARRRSRRHDSTQRATARSSL